MTAQRTRKPATWRGMARSVIHKHHADLRRLASRCSGFCANIFCGPRVAGNILHSDAPCFLSVRVDAASRSSGFRASYFRYPDDSRGEPTGNSGESARISRKYRNIRLSKVQTWAAFSEDLQISDGNLPSQPSHHTRSSSYCSKICNDLLIWHF